MSVGFVWFFRTWWHSPVMWLYATPAVLEAAILWVVVHRLLRRVPGLTRVHSVRWKEQGVESAHSFAGCRGHRAPWAPC
ncbi:MAG: hypothetical protein IMX02_13445 [Limnochordaceae bacterium]|nr:hypothetical protein [Limnochordaceae bacterium]